MNGANIQIGVWVAIGIAAVVAYGALATFLAWALGFPAVREAVAFLGPLVAAGAVWEARRRAWLRERRRGRGR